jgi:hypothetical protein
MTELDHFIKQVNDRIQEVTERNNILYLSGEQQDNIKDNGWHDRYHLNRNSSPIFSHWLANQVIEAIQNEQIIIPSIEQ